MKNVHIDFPSFFLKNVIKFLEIWIRANIKANENFSGNKHTVRTE